MAKHEAIPNLTMPRYIFLIFKIILATKNKNDADTTIAGPVGKSQLSDE